MVLWNKGIQGISGANSVSASAGIGGAKKAHKPQQAAQSSSLMDRLNGMDNKLNQGGLAAHKKKKI